MPLRVLNGSRSPDVQAPEDSSGAEGTNSSPDPDALSPTGGDKDYLWLAVLAGVNTAISVYYYLRIVKAMYLDEPTVDPSSPYFELKAPGLSFFAFVPVLPTIGFGIFFGPVVAVTQSLDIIRG